MPYIVQWQVITPVKIMIKEVSASLIFFMDMQNETTADWLFYSTW